MVGMSPVGTLPLGATPPTIGGLNALRSAVHALLDGLQAELQNKGSKTTRSNYYNSWRMLSDDSDIGPRLPDEIRMYPDVSALVGHITGNPKARSGGRIEADLIELLEWAGVSADAIEPEPTRAPAEAAISENWTGITLPKARLIVLRDQLPGAIAAVQTLIAELERRNSNGGPPLDDTDALGQLRKLHGLLGELLTAIDGGELDGLGQGLLADCIRLTSRLAKSFKDDPVPYAAAALMAAILHGAGAGPVGDVVAGAILSERKKKAGPRTR